MSSRICSPARPIISTYRPAGSSSSRRSRVLANPWTVASGPTKSWQAMETSFV